ncbi:hypothetical protein FGB62_23g125 [Gracilaria domingensis]|nr:hypothetical protein FGB62_23g125 [Gracilaria domingensis]
MRDVFVWNNGSFVDTTQSTGLDSRAADVLGMAGVRRACIKRTDTNSFDMYAVGFLEVQNFEKSRSANGSLCLDGEQTREKRGISISTNRIFNPPADPVYKEDMEGEPAQFTFITSIDRTGTPDYCRVLVTTDTSSEEWTLSSEDFYGRTRFAVRATRNESNTIVVKVGVAYHFLDSAEVGTELRGDETCEDLSTTMFASNRFTAAITEIDTALNLTQLELVVADMLASIVRSGYGRLESQEIMLRAYYAGTTDSDEDSGEPLGTFISRQVAVATGVQQVTELSTLAIVGAVLTAFGTLLLFGLAICLQPQVRLTSSTYVSQLYMSNTLESGACNGKNWDYIEAVDGSGTGKLVRPLSLGYNSSEIPDSDFT